MVNFNYLVHIATPLIGIFSGCSYPKGNHLLRWNLFFFNQKLKHILNNKRKYKRRKRFPCYNTKTYKTKAKTRRYKPRPS